MLKTGQKRIVMGLDVSTKCVGITVASVDDKGSIGVLVVTHIRPKVGTKIKGTEALFLKSQIIANEISKYKELGVTDVVIEEPLIGSNNSGTVATLLRFNGMVSECVYDRLGVVPEFISSYDARRFGCPELVAVRKFHKNGEMVTQKRVEKALKSNDVVLFGEYTFDCAKKLILWNIVSTRFPKIEWQYKKNGDLKGENFDASDSMICVMGYLAKEKYEKDTPKVVDWEKKQTGECQVEYSYTVRFCGQYFSHTIEVL